MNSAKSWNSRPRPEDVAKQKRAATGRMSMAAAARQMGLDPSELGDKAESMWKMLDDLAETDPESYKEFIEGQIEEQKHTPEGKHFIPNAAFVIKTTLPKSGTGSYTVKTKVKVDKLFINVCWHEVIERPINHLGKPVEDNERDTGGMSISMVVGQTRSCMDHTGADALCCDVVVHPWVSTRAQMDHTFKTELMSLVVEWVDNETKLKCISPTILKNHLYKGGIGKDGKKVVPFPVEPEKEKSAQGAGEVTREEEAKSSHEEMIKKAKAVAAGSDVMSGQVMDPSSMIKQMVMGESAGSDNMGKESLFDMKIGKEPDLSNSSSKEKKKPLIEEIGPSSSLTPADDMTSATSKTEKKKKKTDTKKKKAVKSGFLNSDKQKQGLGLYPKEGSAEGGKEGSYSRLMSRSKIVDMSKMTPEQQTAAMAQHAGAPGGGPPGSGTPMGGAPTSALSNMGADIPGMPGMPSMGMDTSAGAPNPPEGEQDFGDMEFEELMKRADPDYAKTAPKEDNDTINQLMDQWKLLSGGTTTEIDGLLKAAGKKPPVPKAVDQPKEGAVQHAAALDKKDKTKGAVKSGLFVPSSSHTGVKQGYVFKTGEHGTGYYADKLAKVKFTFAGSGSV